MSRGFGRVERGIRDLFGSNPDLAFITDELVEHCYPGAAIERKHRVAVLRAARNVIAGCGISSDSRESARMSPDDLTLSVAWVACGMVKGPAYGVSEDIKFWELSNKIASTRRIGAKDGCAIIPTKFKPEPDDPRKIRRLARNALARSAVVLDIETNNKTGEVPPRVIDVLRRIKYAAIVWTTHSHEPSLPRYRILAPLSRAIAPDLPAVEIIAQELGLDDVMDRSKIGPASIFYLPSAACSDDLAHHETYLVTGNVYDAALMEQRAGSLLATRQAEGARIAAEVHAAAQQRRQERIAAGVDSADSLIEKLRCRLDIDSILRAHGYDTAGQGANTKYRHPASQSGQYGADIKVFGGVPRVFSHNAGDPLHASNLPAWCTVTAVDAFDATVILDFGGDRQKAMIELGKRLNILKPDARKAIAALIHRLAELGAPDAAIWAAAYQKGVALGLSQGDVREVARYIVTKVRRTAA